MKGTIKSKQEIERLFKQGRRSSCRYCSLIVAPCADAGADTDADADADVATAAAVGGSAGGERRARPRGRCAFIAGKKLGAAPVRSRCKRVMRAAARELGAPWPGADVVFIARRSIADAPHAQVLEQMARLLEKNGLGR